MDDLRINGNLSVPGNLVTWSASRSGGPGGQHVNKVATKVDLRVDFEQCPGLPGRAKARLRRLARNRLDRDGLLMVSSAASRSQSTNLEDARARAAAIIRESLAAPKKRKMRRVSKGAHRRRLNAKRANSDKKEMRKKVEW